MDNLFGGLDNISRGLDASWTKNEVISSNIANIDTPGYQRKTMDFSNLLEREMKSQLGLKNTRLKHLKEEKSSDYLGLIGVDKSTTSLRTDENNVNIDTEMAEMSKNIIYYNVLSQRASNEISKLESAIRG